MRNFTEADWLVALHHISGVGWHTIHKIKETCGSLDQLPEQLSAHGHNLNNLRLPWKAVLKELKSVEIQQKVSELKQSAIRVVTVFDEQYPELLREIAQPPWVLYVLGNVSLLNLPSLAIVGTRHPSHYGRTVARKLSSGIAKPGWVVVSGMAIGIDSEAHWGALEAEGSTVAVLGSGVDVVYPRQNRKLYDRIVQSGAVISEFPPGTQPLPGFFPQRNRIISGLSRGTIIVEAQEKSGSLITADTSMEQNRDVFAIPGPITSPKSIGPNRLIQQGAKCVMTVSDVFEEYPDQLQQSRDNGEEQPLESSQLTMEEAIVMAHLETEPVHLDVLAVRTAFSLAELHPLLLSLQVKRLVKQLPGSQFVRS